METQIHGVPTPPLGYRLAKPGEQRCKGIQFWAWSRKHWEDSIEAGPLDKDFIYAIPLDDGYEYFEVDSTTVQEGDEARYGYGNAPDSGWGKYTAFGFPNNTQLRRPKAKPLPLPGTKETKRYFFGFGTIHSKDYILSEGNAKLIENLLDALKEEKE